jgi:uncharacterized protein (UPF0333 family)
VFAYLAFVLLVPILLLAATMLAAWKRLSQGADSAAVEVENSKQARWP